MDEEGIPSESNHKEVLGKPIEHTPNTKMSKLAADLEDAKNEIQDYNNPDSGALISSKVIDVKGKAGKGKKKGKEDQQLNEAYIIKLDQDTISHRLIESVGMVTDLLKSNKQLRDSINILNREKENIENDNIVLQSDNLELRDRIEILESIIKANANDYENYDWKKIIEEENDDGFAYVKSNNKGVESVASTMVEIKKENRVLKRRVEHLELQISHLTNHFDFQGNIEPTRTLGSESKEYGQNEYKQEDSAPSAYYDNEPNFNYNQVPAITKMRSTGFSRGRKGNAQAALRNSGGSKGARRDKSIRNGFGVKSKKI